MKTTIGAIEMVAYQGSKRTQGGYYAATFYRYLGEKIERAGCYFTSNPRRVATLRAAQDKLAGIAVKG